MVEIFDLLFNIQISFSIHFVIFPVALKMKFKLGQIENLKFFKHIGFFHFR